ncbi:hypothetical protein CPB84DRAFT_1754343 [Gymnopilus junonius]|uniref:Uncharacterized protein n=1 Tax=Gymnopilus junonius TaxID=109634 RepID=A0A9P5TFR8_GYMJU|nr:hypothetical protein CPB84DRAFT_1754343 [Gymnopilus junonius]
MPIALQAATQTLRTMNDVVGQISAAEVWSDKPKFTEWTAHFPFQPANEDDIHDDDDIEWSEIAGEYLVDTTPSKVKSDYKFAFSGAETPARRSFGCSKLLALFFASLLFVLMKKSSTISGAVAKQQLVETPIFIIMVKVPCNCTSYGCGGKDVDCRTQQAHALKDRTIQGQQQAAALKDVQTVLTQKATEASEQVMQDQLDTIAQHLATTTLSDVQGSPYFSSPDLPSFVNPPPVASPMRQAHIHHILKRLSEIESMANALDEEVITQLHHSELPSFLNAQSFPLAGLIGKCRHLDADIAKITSKSAAITAAKDSIKTQLNVIARKLQTAKKAWKEKREVIQSPKPRNALLNTRRTTFSNLSYPQPTH